MVVILNILLEDIEAEEERLIEAAEEDCMIEDAIDGIAEAEALSCFDED
jgi:hypothetical protein